MQTLLPAVEPFAVEPLVHLASTRLSTAIAFRPGRAERLGGLAPAEEAGPVTGGERRGFIQEEELGPAPAAHHLAPHPIERAETDDPGLARPAPAQKPPGRRVVDDAAI